MYPRDGKMALEHGIGACYNFIMDIFDDFYNHYKQIFLTITNHYKFLTITNIVVKIRKNSFTDDHHILYN